MKKDKDSIDWIDLDSDEKPHKKKISRPAPEEEEPEKGSFQFSLHYIFLGMIGLITGAVLNIAGDAIFMRKFKMGITGAGLSTAISQFISFCILFSMFARGKTQCVISLKKVCLDFKI